MGNVKDIAGQRFGRLTVMTQQGKNNRRCVIWLCKCDCGKEKAVNGVNLRNGTIRSCGCLQLEHAKQVNIKHGMCETKLYYIWNSMKRRCLNKNDARYKDYGGRGITVCKEWLDFLTFYNWASRAGYADGLSIDRIDNNKGYSPENCRWATMSYQALNKRTNRNISFNGETKTIKEWSDIFGINYTTLKARLDRGWDIEDALTRNVKKKEICM